MVYATRARTKRWKRTAPPKRGLAYEQLWRVVDGAVADAFLMHPEYLTKAGERTARQSINKRVVGAVLSFAGQPGRAGSVDNPTANDGLCVTVQAVGHLASDVAFTSVPAACDESGKPGWLLRLSRLKFWRGRG